jgi:DNA-binding transcriptional ArsR family regulator
VSVISFSLNVHALSIVHVKVNDDTNVNIWQDGAVADSDANENSSDDGPAEAIRTVTNVETLKALADPIRLNLLAALMRGSGDRPVRSVKELAAELGEPQTKLYRHIKQLEAVGLIRAVSSRVVSGIVEQRYQACQSELQFGPGLTDAEHSSAATEAAVGAVFDLFRSRFFAASRSGRLPSRTSADTQAHRQVLLNVTDTWIPAAKAAAILGRLRGVVADLDQISGEPDGDNVQVNLLIGYFSPEPPPEPDPADG